MVLPAANQFLQLNSVVCSELVFAAEMVFSTVNQSSLPKLWWLQRRSVRCQNCVRCRNGVVSSESVFAIEIVLSAAK
jgi:hypothetical protein